MARSSSGNKSWKNSIARLRAMAWFNAVSQASGLSAFQLEKMFSRPCQVRMTAIGIVRPCLWDKYRRGEVMPRMKKGQAEIPSLVERVEGVYPGTAKWLTLPLWVVLGDETLGMEEIKKVYEGLTESVRWLFIDSHTNQPIFWRREIESKDIYAELSLVGGLDAVTAIFAMIKEAEITQNREQHHLGFLAWLKWVRDPNGSLSEPVLHAINNQLVDLMQQKIDREYVKYKKQK